MDLVSVFIDIFWATATALVPLIVPIIGLMLVFKLISGLLLDRRI